MLYNNDVVEQHIEYAIKQFKFENDLLKKWIKSGREILTCVVCGKPIENVSIQRMLRPYLWDCRECFQKKPRKINKRKNPPFFFPSHFNKQITVLLSHLHLFLWFLKTLKKKEFL